MDPKIVKNITFLYFCILQRNFCKNDSTFQGLEL